MTSVSSLSNRPTWSEALPTVNVRTFSHAQWISLWHWDGCWVISRIRLASVPPVTHVVPPLIPVFMELEKLSSFLRAILSVLEPVVSGTFLWTVSHALASPTGTRIGFGYLDLTIPAIHTFLFFFCFMYYMYFFSYLFAAVFLFYSLKIYINK